MFSPKAVRVYRVTAAILKVLRGGDSDVTNYDIYRVLYSSVTQIYSDFVSLWIITLTYKARKRRLSGIRISSEPFVWFKFIQFIHTHTHTHTGREVQCQIWYHWIEWILNHERTLVHATVSHDLKHRHNRDECGATCCCDVARWEGN